MPGSPAPFVAIQQFDNNGEPAANCLLFTYDAGTSTKRDTFTDYSLSSANTNPIVLDSAGRATIFLSPVLYKFVLAPPTDSDPPTSPIWTRDPVAPPSSGTSDVDVLVTAGEALDAGNCVYLSDGSGGQTAGRWYKADSDQTYSSSAALILGFATDAIAIGTTGTVRISGRMTGLTALTAGSVYFASATAGAITASAPTNAVMVGKADSTTSLVMRVTYGDAGGSIRGVVSSSTQTIGGAKTFSVQPETYIGTATTLPAKIGGQYVADLTARSVGANTTDGVMTDTEIAANMLSANGKALRLRFGSSTANVGVNLTNCELDIGGTQTPVIQSSPAATWWVKVLVVRIDSDSVDVAILREIDGAGTVGSGPVRINGLNFAASIDLRTLATTGAGSTWNQTYFVAQALG